MSDTKKRTRTRSETKVAFQNLDIPNGMSEKELELQAQAAEAVRSSIAELAVDKAAQAITAASLANQKALSTVSEELMNKLQLLQGVKANIDLESKELTKLYGARVISEHLDVLKAEHDDAKANLDKEIIEARAKWAEEKTLLAQMRARESDEFNYTQSQQRKTEDDQWREQARLRNIQEEERRTALEKTWTAREEALKLREVELVELRAAVAKHQEEIKTAVDKAVGANAAQLKKDHEHALELVQKDRQSESMIAGAKATALQAALDRANQLNVELQAALAEANRKNVELANKALDSSSNKSALDAVQNLIKDQQGNGSTKRA